MVYKLYILYSTFRNKYYIGHTGEDINERLRKHNTDHKGFTGGIGDWVIVYIEEYNSKSDAYRRELEIKKWKSRKKTERLIGFDPPDL